MPELIQLNVHVPERVIDVIGEDTPDKRTGLRGRHHWTRRDCVMTAIDSLDVLMEIHEKAAKKASSADARRLFLRVARAMPARLAVAKVVEAQFDDGRPALTFELDGEQWVIAEDANGDLMCVRPDGGQIGHIAHGEIKVIAEREFKVEPVGSLT